MKILYNKYIQKLLGAAIERKPKIENVNVAGGRLIREAKVKICMTVSGVNESKCIQTVGIEKQLEKKTRDSIQAKDH